MYIRKQLLVDADNESLFSAELGRLEKALY